MRMRKLGWTDVELTTVGLGTWAHGGGAWRFGWGPQDDQLSIRTIYAALDAGVNWVDCAAVYGLGHAEEVLGRALKGMTLRPFVATKCSLVWDAQRSISSCLRKESVKAECEASLRRLGLDVIDLYQIHWPLPPMSIEHWAEALAAAVEAGLTRGVGVSNYSLGQMQRAYHVLARYDIPLASNQVEYHLLNRTVEKNGMLARCRELGIRLIAHSPLAKGLLTGKYTVQNPPPGVRGRMFGHLLKNLPPLLDLMTQIGQAHGGKTPSQVALIWIMCKGALPIPGVKTAEQARQNAGALGWRLSEAESQALDAASDRVTL